VNAAGERANEQDALVLEALDKVGVLAQEAIARVDTVSTTLKDFV
jgi:hypothetical protein